MNKVKNFTTTLPITLLEELEKVSKSLKMAKNDILIESFNKWNAGKKKMKLIEIYKKMSTDKEWLEMEKEGLEDYYKNL